MKNLNQDEVIAWHDFLLTKVFIGERFEGLKMLLKRAETACLAPIREIADTITRYPNFPWRKVKDLFPGDWNCAIEAVKAIGKQRFAYLNHELMASHGVGHYRSLFIVCGNLKHRIEGNNPIMQHQILKTSVLPHGVQLIIDQYQRTDEEGVDVSPTELEALKEFSQ